MTVIERSDSLVVPAEAAGDGAAPAAMTLTVSFAGHRDLRDGALRKAVHRAFATIKEAVDMAAATPVHQGTTETILDAHVQVLSNARRRAELNLIVGYAAGADRVAVDVWRELQLGRVHALFPFADKTEPEIYGWTDDPDSEKVTTEEHRVATMSPEFDDFTTLDGTASANTYPYRHPHLEQTRWLVRWSEIVVAAWNGQSAGGPGGTADLVALALAAKQPVVWIDTASEGYPIRLIRSDLFWQDGTFEEVLTTLRRQPPPGAELAAAPLEATELARQIGLRARPPGGKSDEGHEELETMLRRLYFHWRPALQSPWRLFGRLLLSYTIQRWQRARRYFRFRRLARPHQTPAWSAPMLPAGELRSNPLIGDHLHDSDKAANAAAGLHRRGQVMLLMIAVVAVLAGTLPALIPGAKIFVVVFELMLIIAAQWFYLSLRAGRTHYLWSDARRLAERLRALHSTWPVGFDVGDERSQAPSTWTEWYSQVLRRTAGPPRGHLAASAVVNAAQAARSDGHGIVRGQAGYHRSAVSRMHRLHHRLLWWEKWAFIVLAFGLFFYILYTIIHNVAEAAHWSAMVATFKLPGWYSSGLLIVSAVAPAIAAACLGIEAKLGVLNAMQKSEALAQRFDALDKALDASLPPVRQAEILREAASTLIADVDGWREESAGRAVSNL